MKINKFGLVSVLVCAGLLVGPAMAQDAAKPSAVFDHIPAGAMGYVVSNSVKATTDNVDRFLADIGVASMLAEEMPSGLLGLLKSELKLGEGFDASGGLAVVLLDPSLYGVDLADIVQQKMDNKKVTDVKIPFVIMLPGKDLDTAFPALKDSKKTKVGDYTQVDLPPGPMLTAQHGSYILLSPVDKALKAVIDATKTAKDEMTAAQKEVLGRSDLGVYINMKMAAPVLTKIMAMVDEKAKSSPMGRHGPDIGKMMQLNSQVITQTQAVVVSARIAKTGFVFEELIDYVPGSDMAKMLKAIKASDKSLVGRLPNINYVMAGGSIGYVGESSGIEKMSIQTMVEFLAQASGGKISDAQSKKLQALMVSLNDQATGAQFAVGQAPEGAGLIGAAMLIECQDAQKVKGLLADSAALGQEIIQSVGGGEARELTVTYNKDAGGAGVDTIDVSHPQLTGMPEEGRKMMAQFIGEDKIRLMVSSPDKNTVLLTFGGGKAFLEQALKAAKEGGSIGKDKGLAAAMEMMPKNMVGMFALNAGNLVDTISKGAGMAGAMFPPIKINSQVPVLMGAGVTDTTQHVVVLVPTDTIKEVAGIFMMFAQGMRGGMGGPPMGPPGGF